MYKFLKTYRGFHQFLCVVLSFSIIAQAFSKGGTGDTAMGQMLPLIMTGVAGADLMKHTAARSTHATAETAARAKGPAGQAEAETQRAAKEKETMDMLKALLMLAGAAAALMQNSGADDQVRDDQTPTDTPESAGGSPTSPSLGESSPTLAGVCESYPAACSTDTNTGKSILTIPPLDKIKDAVNDTLKDNPNFASNAVTADGLSLNDALKNLDDSYNQAAQGIAAANGAALGKGSNTSDSALAGVGSETGENKSVGLNENENKNATGLAANDGTELLSGSSGGTPVYVEDLISKAIQERGPQKATAIIGNTMTDPRSGRLLNIFERASRALRGTRDRDLLLAKMEWMRKETLKKEYKNKTNSNFAAAP